MIAMLLPCTHLFLSHTNSNELKVVNTVFVTFMKHIYCKLFYLKVSLYFWLLLSKTITQSWFVPTHATHQNCEIGSLGRRRC